MGNPIGWFEIYVEDMDRARAFYQSTLSITLEQLTPPDDTGTQMWAFPADFEQYGAGGALVKMDGFAAGGNSSVVYFSCADCATEEARVTAAGGTVMQPKMSLGEYGFCTIAQDTEGNVFGLHSNQ